VRAPTVFELYQPLLPASYGLDPGFGDFVDPCTTGSAERTGPNAAQVEALCVAQGVPASLLPDFEDSDGEAQGLYGGNPDLDPETADTLTLGVVLQSWSDNPWLSSLQVSVDWYQIEVEDAISQVAATGYVPLCFDPRTNPDFDIGNELCGYFSRDPVSGEIVDFLDIGQNIVGTSVSGVDTQINWGFTAGPGEVGINWLVSWLAEFERTEYRGLPPADGVGQTFSFVSWPGPALPEWRWNLNLNYDWGGLTLAAQWRYVDGIRDVDWDYDVPSYDYFDVFASYAFERGGVENLADEDPPLLPTSISANTDPFIYDVLGRRYYVNLTYRF
jgi:iron complex outermembrane recepter protein